MTDIQKSPTKEVKVEKTGSSSIGANYQIKADLQKPIDILTENILSPASKALLGKHKYTIIVSNQTGFEMKRVDTYNDSENWPLADIKSGLIEIARFEVKSWSFAATYELNGGYQIGLAASSPLMGKDKIDIYAPKGKTTNSPLTGETAVNIDIERIWKEMDNGNDKNIHGGKCRAYIQSIDQGQKVWVFEIKPWWS